MLVLALYNKIIHKNMKYHGWLSMAAYCLGNEPIIIDLVYTEKNVTIDVVGLLIIIIIIIIIIGFIHHFLRDVLNQECLGLYHSAT